MERDPEPAAVKAHPSLPRLSQPHAKRQAEEAGLERVVAAARRLHQIHHSWSRTLCEPSWTRCYECQVKALAALVAADAAVPVSTQRQT